MAAHRKLSPADEAALRDWYTLYQDALVQLRGLGSIRAKAKQYGVDTRTVHNIVKREQMLARYGIEVQVVRKLS